MRIRKLEVLDDETIKELDKDIAERFFIQNKSKIHPKQNSYPHFIYSPTSQ
jgi:hypothetical protein